MLSDDDSISKFLSTGAIVAIVIGSIIGFAICIVFFVILVSLVRHCSQSRHSRTQGRVLQQQYQYPYPHSWATQYPPDITSVSNDPPPYQSVPPPYTASSVGPTKPPYT
jgi:hypothetical protein